jgi:hypothetical protein
VETNIARFLAHDPKRLPSRSMANRAPINVLRSPTTTTRTRESREKRTANRLQPETMRLTSSDTMSANRPDKEVDDKDRHLEEEVDEALEESFPASDPPSFTRGERAE